MLTTLVFIITSTAESFVSFNTVQENSSSRRCADGVVQMRRKHETLVANRLFNLVFIVHSWSSDRSRNASVARCVFLAIVTSSGYTWRFFASSWYFLACGKQLFLLPQNTCFVLIIVISLDFFSWINCVELCVTDDFVPEKSSHPIIRLSCKLRELVVLFSSIKRMTMRWPTIVRIICLNSNLVSIFLRLCYQQLQKMMIHCKENT